MVRVAATAQHSVISPLWEVAHAQPSACQHSNHRKLEKPLITTRERLKAPRLLRLINLQIYAEHVHSETLLFSLFHID